MEGLSKTADVATIKAPDIPAAPQKVQPFMHRELPVDVFGYFGEDMIRSDDKMVDKMKRIFDWATEEPESTLGDSMLRIRRLENKLGQPVGMQTRVEKIYNWVKIQAQIADLQKRQEAMKSNGFRF